MQIYVQFLYPCRVLVGEDLQIYVQYFYPIWKGGGLIFMFWLFLWGCGGRGFADLCSISISVLGCGGRGFADLCSIFISDLEGEGG